LLIVSTCVEEEEAEAEEATALGAATVSSMILSLRFVSLLLFYATITSNHGESRLCSVSPVVRS